MVYKHEVHDAIVWNSGGLFIYDENTQFAVSSISVGFGTRLRYTIYAIDGFGVSIKEATFYDTDEATNYAMQLIYKYTPSGEIK